MPDTTHGISAILLTQRRALGLDVCTGIWPVRPHAMQVRTVQWSPAPDLLQQAAHHGKQPRLHSPHCAPVRPCLRCN